MRLHDANNQRAWSESPELQAWLIDARLDLFSAMTARAMAEGDPGHLALLERYRAAMRPGLARMAQLLAA